MASSATRNCTRIVLSDSMRDMILTRPAYLIDTYLVEDEDVEAAIRIAAQKEIGPNMAWAGFVLIVLGVENGVAQFARDGLVVIGRSGILGAPEHPEYETAWTMVRELGDHASDLCDQFEDEEGRPWEALALSVARAFESVGV